MYTSCWRCISWSLPSPRGLFLLPLSHSVHTSYIRHCSRLGYEEMNRNKEREAIYKPKIFIRFNKYKLAQLYLYVSCHRLGMKQFTGTCPQPTP